MIEIWLGEIIKAPQLPSPIIPLISRTLQDTDDKINWLRGTVLQLQQRSGEQERSLREGLQEVVGKLGRLLETSEQLSLRQEAIDDALKDLQRKS